MLPLVPSICFNSLISAKYLAVLERGSSWCQKTKLWSRTSLNSYGFWNETLRIAERSILSGVFCNFCDTAFQQLQKSAAWEVNSLQILLAVGIHPWQVELPGFEFFRGKCSFCLAVTSYVMGFGLLLWAPAAKARAVLSHAHSRGGRYFP